MDDRTTRLLRSLALVPEAATLEPSWESQQRSGYIFRGTGSDLDDDRVPEDLEYLADHDYLERVFVERISLCPSCGSHALNVHEACLSCTSSNLAQFKALLHFRCGYVGPVTSFKQEPQGLRCPKCNRILADLGTDHDSPGEYFKCRNCAAMFQEPEVGARCLSCGARFSGVAMQDIGRRDVFSYRLTARGAAALREQRLLDDAKDGPSPDDPFERRSVILEEVENARRRRIETGTKFGLIVIDLGTNGAASATPDVAELRRTIASSFKLGRLDSQHCVMLIPNASESLAKTIRKQITDSSKGGAIRAEVVDLQDGESVADALDIVARRIDNHA